MVIKIAAERVCTLAGISSPSIMLQCVKSIWFAYLSTWAEAAEIYGAKYPHLRFAMRDAFLSDVELGRLCIDLEYKARKRLEQTSAGPSQSTGVNTKPAAKEPLPEEGESSSKAKNPAFSADKPKKHNAFSNFQTRTEKEAKEIYPEYYLNSPVLHAPVATDRNEILHLLKKEHDQTKNKKPLTKFEAALRIQLSMTFVLSILHCALMHLRAGVSASQLMQWALNGSIPFVNALAALPRETQEEMIGLRLFFMPINIPKPGIIDHDSMLLSVVSGLGLNPVLHDGMGDTARKRRPSKEKVTEPSSKRTKADDDDDDDADGDGEGDDDFDHEVERDEYKPKDPFVSRINAPLLACRIVRDLGLPVQVLQNALSMMGIPHPDIGSAEKKQQSGTIIDDGNDSDEFLPRTASPDAVDDSDEFLPKTASPAQWLPPPLRTAAPEVVDNHVHVIAVVVVACKLCKGWEFWTCRNSHVTSTKESTGRPSEKNDKAWTRGHRCVPWNDFHLRLLTNGGTKQYLIFLEDTVFATLSYREEYEGFLDWLEKEQEGLSSATEEIASPYLSVEPECVTANSAISGAPNPNTDNLGSASPEERRQWEEANGIGLYTFYDAAYNRDVVRTRDIVNSVGIITQVPPDRPYHPHYAALLEFIAQRELVEPSDIHLKVEMIEKELFEAIGCSDEDDKEKRDYIFEIPKTTRKLEEKIEAELETKRPGVNKHCLRGPRGWHPKEVRDAIGKGKTIPLVEECTTVIIEDGAEGKKLWLVQNNKNSSNSSPKAKP